jgi:hypothetical protein
MSRNSTIGKSEGYTGITIEDIILEDRHWEFYKNRFPLIMRWRRDQVISVLRSLSKDSHGSGLDKAKERYESEFRILLLARNQYAHSTRIFRDRYFMALLLEFFRVVLDFRFSCYTVWLEHQLGRRVRTKGMVLDDIVAGWEGDLRLMSVAAADGLVNEGRNLVIVALVGTDLHIRIFNASGKKVVDKAENELVRGATLTALKKQLNPIPDESDLSKEHKQKIIGEATSIAGHTPWEDEFAARVREIVKDYEEIRMGRRENKSLVLGAGYADFGRKPSDEGLVPLLSETS